MVTFCLNKYRECEIVQIVASVDWHGPIYVNHFGFRMFAQTMATMVMLKGWMSWILSIDKTTSECSLP